MAQFLGDIAFIVELLSVSVGLGGLLASCWLSPGLRCGSRLR